MEITPDRHIYRHPQCVIQEFSFFINVYGDRYVIIFDKLNSDTVIQDLNIESIRQILIQIRSNDLKPFSQKTKQSGIEITFTDTHVLLSPVLRSDFIQNNFKPTIIAKYIFQSEQFSLFVKGLQEQF